jgi:hypothetical protein
MYREFRLVILFLVLRSIISTDESATKYVSANRRVNCGPGSTHSATNMSFSSFSGIFSPELQWMEDSGTSSDKFDFGGGNLYNCVSPQITRPKTLSRFYLYVMMIHGRTAGMSAVVRQQRKADTYHNVSFLCLNIAQ